MKITVFGIGNLLLMDEGIGVHIINKLKEGYEFPEHVSLVDGGTMGLDLLPFFEGNDRVLIIDAVDFRKEPGTIEIIEGENIPAILGSKLSVHQIGLPDMLFAAKLMDIIPPEICLIGIQPKSIETGAELTEEIKDRVEFLTEKVLQKLEAWGVEPVKNSVLSD